MTRSNINLLLASIISRSYSLFNFCSISDATRETRGIFYDNKHNKDLESDVKKPVSFAMDFHLLDFDLSSLSEFHLFSTKNEPYP